MRSQPKSANPSRSGRSVKVLFLSKEQRDKNRDRDAEEVSSDGEIVKLHLAKHRNGPTGQIGYAAERYAEAV